MATIAASEARSVFTKTLIDVYREMPIVYSFLRSFFKTEEAFTKYISIEIERMGELVAADVARGTEGNRNKFSHTSEKVYEPPYFREKFDATEIDLYDRVLGGTAVDEGIMMQFVSIIAQRYRALQNKVERAYEKMCAQVMQTGIITVNNGDNIDFKRRAGSMVDPGAGQYWATGSHDVFDDFQTGCDFLRSVGKAQGNIFNAILGAEALNDLYKNDTFQDRQKLFQISLDAVNPPQRLATGGTLHGELSAGSYKVRLWTYSERYDSAVSTDSTTSVPYVDDHFMTILPENPRFKLAFAAVPRLLKAGDTVRNADIPASQSGAFVLGDYIDENASAHWFDLKSAGMPVPVAVDQIYTRRVVAA